MAVKAGRVSDKWGGTTGRILSSLDEEAARNPKIWRKYTTFGRQKFMFKNSIVFIITTLITTA